jgi:hypothetical protein
MPLCPTLRSRGSSPSSGLFLFFFDRKVSCHTGAVRSGDEQKPFAVQGYSTSPVETVSWHDAKDFAKHYPQR